MIIFLPAYPNFRKVCYLLLIRLTFSLLQRSALGQHDGSTGIRVWWSYQDQVQAEGPNGEDDQHSQRTGTRPQEIWQAQTAIIEPVTWFQGVLLEKELS